MFKKIVLTFLALFVLLVAGVVGYAATRPDVFRVERSATIQAPPEKIFAHINTFKQWEAWSPYEKLDPNMKKSFSGPDAGEGAAYSWDGDSNAGAGRIVIAESVAPSRVKMKLEMVKPMACQNTVDFTLEPQKDGGTKVTWAMHGPNTWPGRVMSLFLDCEKMCGGQFEEGLASLKKIAEKE